MLGGHAAPAIIIHTVHTPGWGIAFFIALFLARPCAAIFIIPSVRDLVYLTIRSLEIPPQQGIKSRVGHSALSFIGHSNWKEEEEE